MPSVLSEWNPEQIHLLGNCSTMQTPFSKQNTSFCKPFILILLCRNHSKQISNALSFLNIPQNTTDMYNACGLEWFLFIYFFYQISWIWMKVIGQSLCPSHSLLANQNSSPLPAGTSWEKLLESFHWGKIQLLWDNRRCSISSSGCRCHHWSPGWIIEIFKKWHICIFPLR